MLLAVEGVGDDVAFFAAAAPVVGLSEVAHSLGSTWPPARHMASSASNAWIYDRCLVFAS